MSRQIGRNACCLTLPRLLILWLLTVGWYFLFVGPAPAAPQVSGYVQLEYGSARPYLTAGKWVDPPGPLDSIDFNVSQKGDTGSLYYKYFDQGLGAGAIRWRLRETITGNDTYPAQFHHGEGRLTFDAVPAGGGYPNSMPLPLPPGTGTLRWRHAITNSGVATAYTHLWVAGNNSPGTGWLESFYVGVDPSFSSASREIPFYEGDSLRIQLGAYLGFEGNPGSASSTGVVTWTTGPSFPGDHPANPIPMPRTQFPVTLPPLPDDDDTAIEPAMVAGSYLVAPVTGGAGTTSSIYARTEANSDGVQVSQRFDEAAIPSSTPASNFVNGIEFRAYDLNLSAFEIPDEAFQNGRLFLLQFGAYEVPYTAGRLFQFTDYMPDGVFRFRLRPLDGTGFADTVAGLPFVHGFRFVGEGVAQVWEVNVPAVPEPTPLSICVFSIAGLSVIKRRPCRKLC